MGNGVADDTDAIQGALFANRELVFNVGQQKKTLFFPNGTYLVGSAGLSGSLRGIIERRDIGAGGAALFKGGLRIQGESESGVIIRLADNAPDFQNASSPRYVIFQANYEIDSGTPHRATDGTGLEAYHNYIADLTIDLGASNPGAAGINVMMHNIGAIRRVTVQDAVGMGRSTNEADRAFVGFDEWRQGAGPNHLHHLTVKGCEYGVRIGQSMFGQPIEHLKLDNQGTAGVLLDTNTLWIRGLYSTNNVPVALMQPGESLNHFSTTNEAPFANAGVDHAGTWVYDNGTWPQLLVVDATLLGTGSGAASVSAIRNQTSGGKMFLRNIFTQGYSSAAQETSGVVQSGATTITEYATPPVHNLWGQTPTSLNLQIKETPHTYSTLPNWTSVTSLGVTISSGTNGANMGSALQTAIDNCSTDTLYFPPTANGRVAITSLPGNALHIRGNVRHIVGHGICFVAQPATFTMVFDHPTDNGLPVIVEQFFFDAFAGNPFNWNVQIATPRDVVIMDTTLTTISNTAAATGTLFLEDVFFGVINFTNPQDVYIRAWDIEGGNGIAGYNGGNFWVLGSKTENSQQIFSAVQFADGNYEQLGGYHALANQGDNAGPLYALSNSTAALNANVSLAGVVEGAAGSPQGNWATFVTETQNGVTRNLQADAPLGTGQTSALANRGSHKHLTLFRSKM